MNKNQIIKTVWEMAEPVTEQLGLTLWYVQFVKEGATWSLRIVIDREGDRELPLVRPEHELFEEFLLEVMGEGTCRVRAEDAFSATRTALAARLSQDTEQTVWIR